MLCWLLLVVVDLLGLAGARTARYSRTTACTVHGADPGRSINFSWPLLAPRRLWRACGRAGGLSGASWAACECPAF
eukprot:COSAG01_NODE_564_length_15447_cov_14.174811_16_plen_76_part_00